MKLWLSVICLIPLLRGYILVEATKFSNQWVAEIHGGVEVAQRVARDLGYSYKEQLNPFDNHYLLVRNDHPEVSLRESIHFTKRLLDLDEVKWAEQQTITERSKRAQVPDYQTSSNNERYGFRPPLTDDVSNPTEQNTNSNNNGFDDSKDVGKGDFDSIPSNIFSTNPSDESQLNSYHGVTKHVRSLSSKPSPYENVFNDPMWHLQWYVQDYRVKNMPVMDHNVVPVYRMGYTGKGVTIMVVDDGIEHDHRDLLGNLDINLSYDFCNNKPGCEPEKPRYAQLQFSEGTLCAGVIGMVANNGKCGVGIAYHAKVAGAKVTCTQNFNIEHAQARGIVHELSKVDIYSIPWGSLDDGKNMDTIGIISHAFEKGITEGRKQGGSIYVISAGVGKHLGDNCGADGMANYVGIIVVAVANQIGKTTYYSERCTAIFATAYSGDEKMEAVVTTQLNGDCVSSSTGSSSVPIASGIIALVLQANPDLTYRDVMHLIVMSSEVAPLADNEDAWYKNGKGFWVSNDFGFGLLNAENMVTLAKDWVTVPKKNTCPETVFSSYSRFSDEEGFKFIFDTNACQDTDDNAVRYLEHLELVSSVSYPYRGAISIIIKSPSGTKSTLLEHRPRDSDNSGLKSWRIVSVHNWGENPKGRWTIMVKIGKFRTFYGTGTGVANEFAVVFHGTAEEPAHYNDPRKYAAFRLSDGRTSEN